MKYLHKYEHLHSLLCLHPPLPSGIPLTPPPWTAPLHPYCFPQFPTSPVSCPWNPVVDKNTSFLLITTYRGYIHFTPPKSKSPSDCVRSFISISILAFFTVHSLPLRSLICDNETSLEYREYFLSQRLAVQFVPPQMHRSRSNPAEKREVSEDW